MAYRVLELTLVSARDLKKVNMVTRMQVYAVASVSGDRLTRQRTAPDRCGGCHPTWNATLRFFVPATAAGAAGAFLHVLLRTERALGDRDVGEVCVPLPDLLAGAGNCPRSAQYASYEVRKMHSDKPRGVLNFSYQLGAVEGSKAAIRQSRPDEPVMAYPVGVPGCECPPPPVVQPPRKNKNSNFGLGFVLGAGLLGGAIGGMLIADRVLDSPAYDDGYRAGLKDGSGGG